jgi:hypothetical protein
MPETTPGDPSSAELAMFKQQIVREIAKMAFVDAVEILSIIEVLEAANGNGVSQALNEKGAGRAASHIQRALFTRLHIIVARHYLPARKDDLHAARAFELLKNSDVRAGVTSDEREARLAQAEADWEKCCADERLDSYLHLRHKFLAHLAKPKEGVPVPMYGEVLEIARNTANCFNNLANGTGIVTLEVETQITAQKESAAAFWAPWRTSV